ncbi:acetoacetate--CoA ligase [Pseudonocardia ailaonensis]|uniref:Acetoacetate--CoA ligase n=1 Tax=Pseudonocardia ailaonensis TaxID=367279 RepID=A0ABN2N5S5_9PSEU
MNDGGLSPIPDPVPGRGAAGIHRWVSWLESEHGRSFGSYADLHAWSIENPSRFWGSLWDYYGVRSGTPFDRVRDDSPMPDTRWFPGATVNYAEHVLTGDVDGAAPAVVAASEAGPPRELSWDDLVDAVARARTGLARLGIRRGDRVAAYLPNIPETVVAFLATASLGAVWSSCSPEFGTRAVIDRLTQIDPTVLLAVPGYVFRGKQIDRRAELASIAGALPGLTHVVEVPHGGLTVGSSSVGAAERVPWAELTAARGELEFEPVPFDHPLWILFSSGTTGLPKAIAHGHGGILLEHLKVHDLHMDTRRGDRFLWFTTTSWMMWNLSVSALLRRAAIVLTDGDPTWPGLDAQWRLAAATGATTMGTSPAYLMACRRAGLDPAGELDLSALRQLGVTGSPLPPEGFDWAADRLGGQVYLNPSSGGTDICSGFVGGGPWQPVVRGELAGPWLGVDVTTVDEQGRENPGALGELVIRSALPSMPVRFWNDPGKRRYRAAYFDRFPGLWRHGDWARRGPSGSFVISGRSDATLNRGGVRLGTSEFYTVVEARPPVRDSLVVHLEDDEGGPGLLILFVALGDGAALSDELVDELRRELRSQLSPRHVPDRIVEVPAVPRTITGKKLEAPVKQILLGRRPEEVLDPGALAEPGSIDAFVAMARDGRFAVLER